jgi:hypothetical protein
MCGAMIGPGTMVSCLVVSNFSEAVQLVSLKSIVVQESAPESSRIVFIDYVSKQSKNYIIIVIQGSAFVNVCKGDGCIAITAYKYSSRGVENRLLTLMSLVARFCSSPSF